MDSTDSSFSKLAWIPPELDKKGRLIGYIIEYNTVDWKELSSRQEWKRLNQYPVTGAACLVDGLIPAGDYQFRVIAEYQNKQGPASESSTSKSSLMRSNLIVLGHTFNAT